MKRRASVTTAATPLGKKATQKERKRLGKKGSDSERTLKRRASVTTAATPLPSTDEHSIAAPTHHGRSARPAPRAVCPPPLPLAAAAAAAGDSVR